MTAYHLAQVNIGRLLAPVDDPRIDGFRNALDHNNALAEAQPGFVWRLTGEGNNATDIRPDEADPTLAINVSIWETPEHLAAFVYRTEHRNFVRRRHEWFVPAAADLRPCGGFRLATRPTVRRMCERVCDRCAPTA